MPTVTLCLLANRRAGIDLVGDLLTTVSLRHNQSQASKIPYAAGYAAQKWYCKIFPIYPTTLFALGFLRAIMLRTQSSHYGGPR
jgi:hypothetical protein